VLSLSHQGGDAEKIARGAAVFAEQCVACHKESGVGDRELGAPNLGDSVWLYGGSKPAIVESISYGRGGEMPAWEGRLSPATLKLLAVYVHDLGGGE
jgi:cytochrome c oxidase cbb3-type subunit 3